MKRYTHAAGEGRSGVGVNVDFGEAAKGAGGGEG